jgi:hypothetical protein
MLKGSMPFSGPAVVVAWGLRKGGRPQCHVFQSPGCPGAAIFAAKPAKCLLLNGLLALDRGILPLRIAIRKEKIAVPGSGIPIPAYGIVIPKDGFAAPRRGIVILQAESVVARHGSAIPDIGIAIRKMEWGYFVSGLQRVLRPCGFKAPKALRH